MKVLTLGSTGSLGKHVLTQLLDRGVHVKAIVRSPNNLPTSVSSDPKLTVIQASILHMSVSELAVHLKGCDTVICTLGHNMNYGRIPALGVWLNPRDLVLRATKMVCDAIKEVEPANPIRFVILNTVGVANPDGSDIHVRQRFERGLVSFMNATLPPYTDSVRSANYISKTAGTKDSKYLEWVTVRPDSFVDGEVSEYKVFASIQHSLYTPDIVRRANIAHFMCELVTNPATWEQWKFKMPVIFDAQQPQKK
ncbi:hypothetical protein BGZ94_008293 [Podila epigama]|nr:hypothetical protein BGZ94_008293 [Podila epigama]